MTPRNWQARMQHRHQARDGQLPRARRHALVLEGQRQMDRLDDLVQNLALHHGLVGRGLLVQLDRNGERLLAERDVVHADPFDGGDGATVRGGGLLLLLLVLLLLMGHADAARAERFDGSEGKMYRFIKWIFVNEGSIKCYVTQKIEFLDAPSPTLLIIN